MTLHGVEFNVSNKPPLDIGFAPLAKFNSAFLCSANEQIAIALERSCGQVAVYNTYIHGTDEMYKADCFYINRLIKFLLWGKGGFRLTVCGNKRIAEYVREAFCTGGIRAFDAATMARIYEHPFEVLNVPFNERPQANENALPLGRHLDGCRIGFDAGGSDRKVSAVINGEAVFSEEVVWNPKTNADPDYHYNGIVEAFKSAAEKMPRVDAIGVSSAGVYIDNRTMIASLFLAVPDTLFREKVQDIYVRAASDIGDVPLTVANDGDVTALAGAMELNDDCVLGIAMGTSEAGGYVDANGSITGWLNELAFIPVDGQEDAAQDEWSGDIGCGVKYFSQDAVIKLAPAAGIKLNDELTPAQKLKVIQEHMQNNHKGAQDIYRSIGVYLAHAIALYTDHYEIRHILLLGRVMSGKGGELIINEAVRVLEDEYADISGAVALHLPDENSRRVGQSVAAASLPALLKG